MHCDILGSYSSQCGQNSLDVTCNADVRRHILSVYEQPDTKILVVLSSTTISCTSDVISNLHPTQILSEKEVTSLDMGGVGPKGD